MARLPYEIKENVMRRLPTDDLDNFSKVNHAISADARYKYAEV